MLQGVTIFGDRVFKEVIELQWGHQGKSKSSMAGIPIRRGNVDTDMYIHTGKTTWRHRETTAIGKPRREASEGPSPGRHFDLGLPASRIVRKRYFYCLILSVCYGSFSRLIQVEYGTFPR